MSKQLFLPKAGLASVGTEISALATGEAGFFKAGTTVAVADLDLLGKSDLIQIIAKRADGTYSTSSAFTLSDIVSVNSAAASDGTVQSTDITPVLPATQVEGDSYTLRVVETTNGNRTNERKSFEVVNKGVDFTVASLIDAFVALVGTNLNVHVTAVDGTTKLTLNSTDPNRHFRVAVDGKFKFSVINYATPNAPASGKAAQVAALEAECESFADGITNKVGFPVNRPNSQVTEDDYTIVTVAMDKKGHNVDSANPVKYDDLTLYIAETTSEVGAELVKAINGLAEIADDDS